MKNRNGAGASAICFVTWNFAVQILGAVRTSVYIYVVPVVTIVMSVLILHEELSGMAAAGAGLTLLGLIISEGKMELKVLFTSEKQDVILRRENWKKEE